MRPLPRITTNPEIMGGKPCIRGMRVTVGMVVESLAAGRTIPDLLADFPYLEEQDIRESLAYAASLAQGCKFPPCDLRDQIIPQFHKGEVATLKPRDDRKKVLN